MKHSQVEAFRAALIELGNLADAAERCAVALEYTSPRVDSMKKYHRDDRDLALWLDRIEDAASRLARLRTEVPMLAAVLRQDVPKVTS